LISSTILNLPNLITLLRIGAIPLFLILLTDKQYTEALIVFTVAAATDSLDGAIARLTNSRTVLGSYIDPLADKLLLVSSFLILTYLGFIPHWLAILVVSRDVIILVGFLVLFVITGHSIVIQPTFVGKASTFFQLLTVTQTLLALHNPLWRFAWLWGPTLAVTGAATVVSGLQYLVRAVQWASLQDEDLALRVPREAHPDSQQAKQQEERRRSA